MPELPEVEHFRQLLLPLVSSAESPSCLTLERPSPTPPKSFPEATELDSLRQFYVSDVKRKGKLLRLDMRRAAAGGRKKGPRELFLFVHMGMTGRISTPDHVPDLESLSGGDSFPPPHTHLILQSNGREAAFSDPRRFGAVTITSDDQFADLAPDALNDRFGLEGLVGQRKGVKALLLDQRAIFSGVGNWVADEVLYQSGIHPDQSLLTAAEADAIDLHLASVLKTAVACLKCNKDFPEEWIFNYRWSKGSSKGRTVKDCKGRKVSFLQSGGRTSAVVLSIQKLKSRRAGAANESTVSDPAMKTKREHTAKREQNQEKSQENMAEKEQRADLRFRRSKRRKVTS